MQFRQEKAKEAEKLRNHSKLSELVHGRAEPKQHVVKACVLNHHPAFACERVPLLTAHHPPPTIPPLITLHDVHTAGGRFRGQCSEQTGPQLAWKAESCSPSLQLY